MARARNIKPGLLKNEVLGVADPLYTILFEGLWLLADREGRLENRPLRIKAEVFPYREGLSMEDMLSWLAFHEFIAQYEVGGKQYIQILNFTKHQNPHKNEPASVIPAMDGAVPIKSEVSPNSDEALGLIPDSGYLIPDSGNPPKPPKGGKKPAVGIQTFLDSCQTESVKAVPDDDPIFQWADDAGVPMEFLRLAWREFVDRYRDGTKRYADWRAVFRKAVRGNWLKLWYIDTDGNYVLTTVGQQASRVYREAA